MGIVKFFKNIIENARGVEPIQEAHIVNENTLAVREHMMVDVEKFYKLRLIFDLHIVECERIVEEINNALQGREYDECISFDWADPDLILNYPNVELYGEITSMTEFKSLLLEWIDYRAG